MSVVTTANRVRGQRVARRSTLGSIGTWLSSAVAGRLADIRAGVPIADRHARSTSPSKILVEERSTGCHRRPAPARERGRGDRGRADTRAAARQRLGRRTTRCTACTRASRPRLRRRLGDLAEQDHALPTAPRGGLPRPGRARATRSSGRSSTSSATTPGFDDARLRAELESAKNSPRCDFHRPRRRPSQ